MPLTVYAHHGGEQLLDPGKLSAQAFVVAFDDVVAQLADACATPVLSSLELSLPLIGLLERLQQGTHGVLIEPLASARLGQRLGATAAVVQP